MTTGLIPGIAGARAVLAASTGGHLAQLHRLAPRLALEDDPLWITFDSEQSRSLLSDERVIYVPYISPRDLRGAARALPAVARALAQENFSVAVSTGAAIAAVALPLARARGREAVYIESVSRFDGPSLTGRMMRRVPGIKLYNQHQSWAQSPWEYRFSVLDDYVAEPGPEAVHAGPLKVFVTLGTIRPYRFDALVDRLLALLPGADFRWQLGVTTRSDLPGRVSASLSDGEFRAAIEWSDVVVSHAGVGTALQLLDLGMCPVLVPRRAQHGEHVDDHQAQIANHLGGRGLAVSRAVDDLSSDDIVRAQQTRIRRAS